MRLMMIVGAVLALATGQQERADLARPIQTDRTVRSYQVTGFNVSLPPTIYKPPNGPTAAPPPIGLMLTNLTIRYVDNLGTEYVDAHTDTQAEKLIRDLFLTPTGSGGLYARLLQHLIAEGKIPAATIRK